MNTNKMFRLLMNSSNIVFGPHKPHIRVIQRLPGREMATNVSISQIAKEKETFMDELPNIMDFLMSKSKFSQLPEIATWVKQILEYNLTGGKNSRGLATLYAYEMLEKPENINEDSLRRARTVGWCVEMLQAFLLVTDDIVDGSSTRRGMPCWYRLPNVGLGAINDSVLINCSIFEIIKANFSDKPLLQLNLIEQFNEALLHTMMGQCLDYSMAHNKHDYATFTLDRYYSIVKYKTSYYTFKLPVCLGLHLANIVDTNTHKIVEEICLELGKLFQIQDDYLDCFGDTTVTGKAGTDIQEGKCSWLAVHALQRCSQAQKTIFINNYASKDPEHIDTIKQLYRDLKLPEAYKDEETLIYKSIMGRIDVLPHNVKQLFVKIADMIYNREH